MTTRRSFLGFAASAAAVASATAVGVTLASQPAAAQTAPIYTGIIKGVAVGGYDPVAYFTQNKPVKGNPAIALEHGGAKYHFASEANRETFKKEPAKYEPQYGGYCAWAVSQGYTAHGDPNAWSVHNGKLFLNYNQSVRATWAKDIPGNVAKGDANWPKVLAK